MKANLVSSLFRAIQNRAASLPNHSFKRGQVVTGNITKLYPNQQAVVKIAGKELMAQLQVPLTKGKTYWFQVDSVDPYLNLKVAAEGNQVRQDVNIKQLLSHFGLRITKDRQTVLKELMESEISMLKNQLVQVMLLIDQIGKKDLDMQAVKEIIKRDLPVTLGVYQAFRSRNSQPLKQQLTEVLVELKAFDSRSPSADRLINRINQLLLLPPAPTAGNQSAKEAALFHTLKGEKITMNLSTKAETYRVAGQENTTKISEALIRLMKEQLPIDVNAKKQFVQFSHLFTKLQSVPITSEEIARLNFLFQHLNGKGVFDKVAAFNGLPTSTTIKKTMNAALDGTGNAEKAFISSIDQIAAKQLTPHSEAVLYEEIQKIEATRHVLMDPKIYFLTKMKNYLIQMGLNYEPQVVAELNGNEKSLNHESLKSLLLQVNQDGIGQGKTAKLDMLIHTLNGIQLSSIQESQEFLQLSMQLPGDEIGMKEDVFLDFESKKNAEGEIDPSFCRILFYLSLENLKETVVDMNVADRAVSITIYSDKEADGIFERWRPSLESGLHNLDYKLVSLKVKDGNAQQVNQTAVHTYSSISSGKGVDFRI